MSIQPAARLLTVAEYRATGEVEHGYSELVERRLGDVPEPVAPAQPRIVGDLSRATPAAAG